MLQTSATALAFKKKPTQNFRDKKENTEDGVAVSESHGSEGSAPETNSPLQLSDSLCCKNNRALTHPTLKWGEYKSMLHSLEKKPQGRIESRP